MPIAAALKALEYSKQGIAVPRIARLHAEEIAGLDERTIYAIIDAAQEFEETEKLRAHVLREIGAQNALTAELEAKIRSTWSRLVLEDIYLPFKLKGRTTATIAKEAGLGALADWLWQAGHSETALADEACEAKLTEFIKPEAGLADRDAVVQGVSAILTEKISENAELRSLVRTSLLRKSKLKSERGPKAKEKSKFSRYFSYREPIGSLKRPGSSQRYLMLRKGWTSSELVLSFERADEGLLTEAFEKVATTFETGLLSEILRRSARQALNSSVFTVMENEAHKLLKENAEDALLSSMMRSLEKRIFQAPFGPRRILGVDPGSEGKGASLAVIDENGALLFQTGTNFEKEEEWAKLSSEFGESVEKIGIAAVAILHGEQGKLARKRILELLKARSMDCPVITVYEQAATIYSTSSVAKEELPELEPGVRRAAFAGRLLQDPLRELVKVDPKFLATGALQFDIQAAKLGRALFRSIQAVVAFVGVDVNNASRSLLAYVPGLDHAAAKAIVQHRKDRGPFKRPQDIASVSGVSDKAAKEAQGFLFVGKASDPEARFGFLPEEWALLENAIKTAFGAEADPLAYVTGEKVREVIDSPAISTALGQFRAPWLLSRLRLEISDPRGKYEPFQFALSGTPLIDVKADQLVPGVITNITSFGVFIDVGIEQDGLIHISEFQDPLSVFENLAVGQVVQVWIAKVLVAKNQLSLSFMSPEERKRERAPRPRRPQRPRRDGANAAPEGANANASGGDGRRPERSQRPRGPRPGEPRSDGPRGPGEAQDRAFAGQEQNANGEGRSRNFRGRRDRDDSRGGPAGRGDKKAADKAPAKKRPPQRDPKTGAVMKMDDSIYTSTKEKGGGGGPRFATKAKPSTHNPFAKLSDLLKGKSEG